MKKYRKTLTNIKCTKLNIISFSTCWLNDECINVLIVNQPINLIIIIKLVINVKNIF